MSKLPQVAVCCIFAQDYRVLGVKRNSGFWGLPGGKLEENETILQAGYRELDEETGIKVHKHPEIMFKEVVYRAEQNGFDVAYLGFKLVAAEDFRLRKENPANDVKFLDLGCFFMILLYLNATWISRLKRTRSLYFQGIHY